MNLLFNLYYVLKLSALKDGVSFTYFEFKTACGIQEIEKIILIRKKD